MLGVHPPNNQLSGAAAGRLGCVGKPNDSYMAPSKAI